MKKKFLKEFISHPSIYPISLDKCKMLELKDYTTKIIHQILTLAASEHNAELDYNMEKKTNVVISELLTNVYKYEKSAAFKIGVNIESNMLVINFFIHGDEYNIEKAMKAISETETLLSKGVQPLGNMGLYHIKKFSDGFEVFTTEDPMFKIGMEIKFKFNW